MERSRQRILLSGDVPSPIDIGDECSFAKRCPYATEECKRRRPALEEVAPGHFVACHNKGKIN